MALRRQATSHYLNQCWPSSLMPMHICGTRGRWVKSARCITRTRPILGHYSMFVRMVIILGPISPRLMMSQFEDRKWHTDIKVGKMHILQCMGSKFCMIGALWNFHTKFWMYTPQNMHLWGVKNFEEIWYLTIVTSLVLVRRYLETCHYI